MPTGTVMPSPKFTGWNDAGAVIAGGLLYTYLAGTTTPEPTYSDSALTVPNANPIVLDAAGRATVFLAEKTYKFVLKTAAGATVWTQDNIAATHLAQSGGLGEVFSFGGSDTVYTANVAYPAGATLDKLHSGTGVWNVDSATLPGTYRLEGVLRGAGGATVTVALVNLDDGAPDTAIVTIASNSATGARVQSGNIAFAAGGSAKNYGVKIKVDVGTGYAWGIRVVRVG